MSENIIIPLPLLVRLVELLEYWNLSGYDYTIRDEYYCVLRELKVKMQKIKLRDAYAKIIAAKDPDARDSARVDYLRLKSQVGDVDVSF